jgi:hypothetical protein
MEDRFERWMAAWPTGCPDFEFKELPVLGHLGTDLGRSARLPLKGKVRADLFLRLREMLVDDPSNDDWINLEFAPANVAFPALLSDWLPAAAEVFSPYSIVLAAQETLLAEYEAEMGKERAFNPRKRLELFHPATFLSAELCANSFGRSPTQLTEILGSICHTRTVGSGVLVVMSMTELTQLELLDRRREIAARIDSSKPR